jgi:hypothetical protein
MGNSRTQGQNKRENNIKFYLPSSSVSGRDVRLRPNARNLFRNPSIAYESRPLPLERPESSLFTRNGLDGLSIGLHGDCASSVALEAIFVSRGGRAEAMALELSGEADAVGGSSELAKLSRARQSSSSSPPKSTEGQDGGSSCT